MKKRIAFALVSVVLALSILSVTVFAADMKFTDVKKSDWFYNDVKTAFADGLINGKSETTFAPNDALTYSEAVKLAACMHERYTKGKTTLTNGTPWYQPYVDYCKKNSIISKDYDWTAKVTRAGYMEIFAKALPDSALKAINTVPDGSIPDVSKTHPQADAIYKLYRAGILQGNDAEHHCSPSSTITRSAVAAILTRMMYADKRVSFSMGNETPLTVKTQPKDVAVAKGDTATFSVQVTGGKAPYSYRWFLESPGSSGRLSGKTDSSMSTAPITDFTATYYCVITDADGKSVTTRAARVTEKVPPLTITKQPQDLVLSQEVTSGAMTVAVSGGKTPYTYKWSYSIYGDFEWAESEWTGIPDSNSPSLPLYYAPGKTYYLRCTITDANGSTVISKVGKCDFITAASDSLIITEQPRDVTASPGDAAMLSVSVKGGKAPYYYQWYSMHPGDTKRHIVGDAKSDRLILPKIDTFGYQYFCEITDSSGQTVVSTAAVINELK